MIVKSQSLIIPTQTIQYIQLTQCSKINCYVHVHTNNPFASEEHL